MKVRIIKKKVIDELSSVGGAGGEGNGKIQGYAKREIDERYSTSGAMMGAGSGQIPKERNPKAHKRYVRIRFTRQGLQNFKPNRYFPDRVQQLGEKKHYNSEKR
tara:strand:+ start:69 stop:380 length:312 start_codon:yes stop_codon:yes gene_type:complete